MSSVLSMTVQEYCSTRVKKQGRREVSLEGLRCLRETTMKPKKFNGGTAHGVRVAGVRERGTRGA